MTYAIGPWRAIRDSPLWVCLFLVSAAAGLTPVADGDVFWHLAAGREMVRTGAFLQRDPFSISAAGRPWPDVHWLFQLAIHAAHDAGGLRALVLAKALLVGCGALLLCAAIDRGSRPLFVVLLGSALLCARHLLLVRPVIVSLLLLAFFFLQLERSRRFGRIAGLATLPLAQIVWSNCQGLSALGPALVAAYALGAACSAAAGSRAWFPFAREISPAHPASRRLRALLLTLAACIAASLATPYGLRALTLPVTLLDRLLPRAFNPYLAVAENVPPFALERLEPEQFWHLKWVLAALGVAFALPGRRIALSHLLLLVGFLALALIANRNVLLFYWLATPIAALQLAPRLHGVGVEQLRSRSHEWARWLVPGAIAALLVIAGAAAAREPSFSQPTPFRFPVRSAEILRRTPGTAAIFSADQQGGYLIWTLYPRFRPYMDTRLVLRTPQEFDEYLGLAQNPERFNAFQQRHRFAYAILPVAYPDRYLPLIAHLYDDPEWKLTFTNGSEVLFARRALDAAPGWDLHANQTTDRILAELARDFGPAQRLHQAAGIAAASLEMAVGEIAQAERILSTLDPHATRALRARTRLGAGDLQTAQQLAEQLLQEADDDVRSLSLMAAICMRRGQLQRAAHWLRRALAIDPYDAEAASLRKLLEQHDDP